MFQHLLSAHAMTPVEIAEMRQAVLAAAELSKSNTTCLIPIVYELYCKGLRDPTELAAVASELTSSKVYQ